MPNLSELMAALPAELDDAPADARSELTALLASMADKPVPVGRWTRLWVLGTLPARVAAAYIAWFLRKGFASGDETGRRLNEARLAAAIRLIGGMSYMRGAIMKLGQALASYPDIMPDEFAEMLTRLHSEAPPMHFGLLREHLRSELGADPRELFAEFETEAFAAASLGQVHRARLKTGQLVAVKIQYPNIGRTIREDLANLQALLAPMRFTEDWQNVRYQLEDICRVLERETDYEQEAGFQKDARAAFTPEEGIVVPRVYEAYSTRRVLTMDHLPGQHLDDYLPTNPSQAERDRFGHALSVVSARAYYGLRWIYADPNPGNFLFMPDGRLGLIDFGCCRRFSDEEWRHALDLDDCLLSGDRKRLRELLIWAAMLSERQAAEEERMRFLESHTDWMNAPLEVDGPFDFGSREFFEQGAKNNIEVMRRRYFRSRQIHLWTNRCIFGFRVLLYRLRARVNLKAIIDAERRHMR